MVIGLLILTAIPTVTGVALAHSGQKTAEQREKDAKRMAKFHIDVHCEVTTGPRTREVHGHRIVLKDGKVFIGPIDALNPSCSHGYVAEAFYVEYPDSDRDPVELGLASQCQDSPPLLNWIYVDKNTMELRHGNKTTSVQHHVGPWDWTEDEESITLVEMEQFIAVEAGRGRWQVYFDTDDDGLSKYVPKGKKRFRISLGRTLIPGGEK